MITPMSLSELATETGGIVAGDDVIFSEVSIDSRTINNGDVYLALIGEKFNGHEFVKSAAANGAAAAIVSEKIESPVPTLTVSDTHKALGQLALINRRRSKASVIALTGSQGKTTVKEMAGAILNERASTLITSKNLNNTIGVPLTLLQLDGHEFAVIEMGANGAGEIAFSVGITQPNIVLITKASAAHIEGFGSLQGIVEAKGEILDGLVADGTAVLNGDDDNVGQWIKRAGEKRVVLFSLLEKSGSSYYSSEIDLSKPDRISFVLHTPKGNAPIKLNMMGEHNVANAISAAALALESGAGLNEVSAGLAKLSPIDGRLKPRSGLCGSLLLDDTYNASPDSFYSAIDTLMSFSGRRIVVAGDMKELGDESQVSHEAVGRFAAQAEVDEFWVTGEMSKWAAQAYGDTARYFSSQEDLVEQCKQIAAEDVVFLVKGSRGAKMENIINQLLAGETV